MGAYCKSGASPIAGLIKPGDVPPRRRACTCSTSCPTASSASAFPTSTTTPRSPS